MVRWSPASDRPRGRRFDRLAPVTSIGRRLLGRFGYQLARSEALDQLALAHHLRVLFGALDVDCVLDVGANRGQYHRFMRRSVGFEGSIVSFEPVAANAERLRSEAKWDPKWLVRGHALGNEEGIRAIRVMKADPLSSFLDPHPACVRMLREQNVVDRTESVPVRRLDSVMRELRAEHDWQNVFLKLDTQGFDREVVLGADATLPSLVALQTELSVQPVYAAAPGYREMLDLLAARGFAISAMAPVLRDERMRVIEFDCVMVNEGAEKEDPSW